MVKERELVRVVERYWQRIVRLTSTHSLGSGTQLIERDCTVKFSGVACMEQRSAVGLLIASQLSCCVLNVLQKKLTLGTSAIIMLDLISKAINRSM